MEKPEAPKSVHAVHHYNILLKLHYFFYFAAFGTFYPFISVILRSRGITDLELGFWNMIVPFILFFTNPLAAYIADHTKRFKLTFNVFLVVSNLLFASFFFIPKIQFTDIKGALRTDDLNSRNLEFFAQSNFLSKCQEDNVCSMRLFPETDVNNELNIPREEFNKLLLEEDPSTGLTRFVLPITSELSSFKNWTSFRISCSKSDLCPRSRAADQTLTVLAYCILLIVSCSIFSNVITLGVSLGFASLEDPDSFGKQRLFGTIGFGLALFIIGQIQQWIPSDEIFIVSFTIYTVICIVITCFIRIQPKHKEKVHHHQHHQEGKKTRKGVFALLPILKKLDTIVFLTLAFLWGTSYAVLDPHVPLYVDRIDKNNSRLIISLMGTVSAVAELLAFFFSMKIMKKLGTDLCSILIFIAFAIRFAGYYFIPNAFFFMPVELMHFFNFGIYYVIIVQDANTLAPRGLSGTLQGLALGISFGLGRGCGLIGTILILEFSTTKSIFSCYAIFNVVAAIVFSVYFLIRHKTQKKKEEQTAEIKNNQLKDEQVNQELLEKEAS